MRLIIDLQGAQSASRHRGIGRYSLALAKALVRARANHEVLIVLNGLFPETIEPLRKEFDGLLAQDCVRVWYAPQPLAAQDSRNAPRRAQAELLREAFIAALQPDAVWISSLIEGWVDDAVGSTHRLCAGAPVFATLYDLIPLLNPQHYLHDRQYANHFHRQVQQLKQANGLWAISRSAGQEAVQCLAYPKESVFNIGTAADDCFQPLVTDAEEQQEFLRRFQVSRGIVMYTSADDERKNHKRLIEAYAQLPGPVRAAHQLVLVGRIADRPRQAFLAHAARCGLRADELVMTGAVSDADMCHFYNLCTVFVFPSWHEGFGLPALEAMQCGAAVIGSNTSSVPEVLGREDALFDPFDVADIAQKMEKVLLDAPYRQALRHYALRQAAKFSWQACAERAWQCLEQRAAAPVELPLVSPSTTPPRRPKLAYVSPLPPAASGISDYSSELLPALARHYQIEVVVDQTQVTDPWVLAHCQVRDPHWFQAHAAEFDRIVYHFGNSTFHTYMFALLREHPGVVVLHDFYLSGVLAHLEISGAQPQAWSQALLASHGWAAVAKSHESVDHTRANYPCNLPILQDALGVVVHSAHALQLAQKWYGSAACAHWEHIALLRKIPEPGDRTAARRALGIPQDAFVVCSFGLLDPSKLNHRLLHAWFASALARDPQSHLVFVGENHGGDYGQGLHQTIHSHGARANVQITGWADLPRYRLWLQAADVGIQLRTRSRGETSAAVLDCMGYGLATIVNANGAMAELPPEAVWMLADDFEDTQLVSALEQLRQNPDLRARLQQCARQAVLQHHDPARCSDHYAAAFEKFYVRAAQARHGLLAALANLEPGLQEGEFAPLAAAIASNDPPAPRMRQLLVDISALAQTDLRTGIERVTRSVLRQWLLEPPAGWTVRPVYAHAQAVGYQYANAFVTRFLGLPRAPCADQPVDVWQGDVYLGLDYQPFVALQQADLLRDWHRRGVQIDFVLYDLLPIRLPAAFPAGAQELHQQWLQAISTFHAIHCISRTVADDLGQWFSQTGRPAPSRCEVKAFHLGADTQHSVPSTGLPSDSKAVLSRLRSRTTFLTVATLEPRKAHMQTLDAFDALWSQGRDVNWVIVGNEGWKSLPDAQRGVIPSLVQRLRKHPLLGEKLFWIEGASDQYLDDIYAASACLIAPSQGEGFGLPLIEAAQHALPILARDIPVFREVAGASASYFPDDQHGQTIAAAIEQWLEADAAGLATPSGQMHWSTWAQAASQLLTNVLPVASARTHLGAP